MLKGRIDNAICSINIAAHEPVISDRDILFRLSTSKSGVLQNINDSRITCTMIVWELGVELQTWLSIKV